MGRPDEEEKEAQQKASRILHLTQNVSLVQSVHEEKEKGPERSDKAVSVAGERTPKRSDDDDNVDDIHQEHVEEQQDQNITNKKIEQMSQSQTSIDTAQTKLSVSSSTSVSFKTNGGQNEEEQPTNQTNEAAVATETETLTRQEQISPRPGAVPVLGYNVRSSVASATSEDGSSMTDNTETQPGAVPVEGIGSSVTEDESSVIEDGDTVAHNAEQNNFFDEEAVLSSAHNDLVHAYAVDQDEEAEILDEKKFAIHDKKKIRQRRIFCVVAVILVIAAVVVATIRATRKKHNSRTTTTTIMQTPSPSSAPSPAPSSVPTTSAAPTNNCGLSMAIECIDPSTGLECHEIQPIKVQIVQDPDVGFRKLGFAFRASACSTLQVQSPETIDQTSCVDYLSDPAAITDLEKAFIHVTDSMDSRVIYFSGFVDAGASFHTIESDALEESPHLHVAIYNASSDLASDILSNGTLVQELDFGTSHETGMEVGNVYASLHVIELEGSEGVASCVATAKLTLLLWLSHDETGLDQIELNTLEIMTNRPGTNYFNKTDEVQNKVVVSESFLTVTRPPSFVEPQAQDPPAPDPPLQNSKTVPPRLRPSTHAPAASSRPTFSPVQRRRPLHHRSLLALQRKLTRVDADSVDVLVTTESFSMDLDLCKPSFYEVCYSVSGFTDPQDNTGLCSSQGSYSFNAGESMFPDENLEETAPTESICRGFYGQ